MVQDTLRMDKNTKVERPEMVKSKFNNSGDLTKELNNLGLVKSIKEMVGAITSVKDFIKKQNETIGEKISNAFSSDKKATVQGSEGSIVEKNMGEDLSNISLSLEPFLNDMKSYFKEQKWQDKVTKKFRDTQIKALEGLKNSGFLKFLFILISVGVVTLLTKVMAAVKTFSSIIGGVTKLFKIGEKIPLIGKVFTPIIKGLGGVGSILGKFGGLIDNVFKGFLKIIGPVAKFFGLGARFMKALPVIGWVITGIMAVIDGIKGFFQADEIFGHVTTFGEKMVSAFASVISGLLLGLVDTKTIVKIIMPIKQVFDVISVAVGDFINIFKLLVGYFKGENSMDDVVDSVGTFVKNIVVGIFTYAFVSLPKLIGNLLLSTLKLVFISLPKMMYSIAFGTIKAIASIPKLVLNTVLTAMKVVYSIIPKFFADLMSSVLGKISDVFSGVADFFGRDSIIGSMFAKLSDIAQMASDGWGMIADLFGRVGEVIDNVKGIVNKAFKWFFSIIDTTKALIFSFYDWIANFKQAFTDVISTVGAIFEYVLKWSEGLISGGKKMINSIKGVFTAIWGVYKNMVLGIKDKLISVFGSIVDTIASVVGDMPNKFITAITSAMTSIASVMANLTSIILTKVKDAVSGIPIIGKLFGGDDTETEVVTPKQENKIESEPQTDNGKKLEEAVKPVPVAKEENNAQQTKQLEMMDKQNKIFEQMLSKLAPQTNIAFN